MVGEPGGVKIFTPTKVDTPLPGNLVPIPVSYVLSVVF